MLLLSNSRKKFLATTYQPYLPSLYRYNPSVSVHFCIFLVFPVPTVVGARQIPFPHALLLLVLQTDRPARHWTIVVLWKQTSFLFGTLFQPWRWLFTVRCCFSLNSSCVMSKGQIHKCHLTLRGLMPMAEDYYIWIKDALKAHIHPPLITSNGAPFRRMVREGGRRETELALLFV